MSAKKTRRKMLAHSSVGFGLTALRGLLSGQRPDVFARGAASSLHPSRTRPPRAQLRLFCFMSGRGSAVATFAP